jgi:hypothetical protein
MKTLSYTEQDWGKLWYRLSRDYTAMSIGKELKFELRKAIEVWSIADAPGGFDRVDVVHLDFEHDEDYTMFVLKYL